MRNKNDPWILGLGASHNGSVCLLKGDEIVVAIQEERLLGFKRARLKLGEPSLAINYCLQYANIGPEDVDCVAVSSQTPLAHPMNDLAQNAQLGEILSNAKFVTIGHHNAHAYSAFATSGFSDSAVLVIDGMGGPYSDLFADEKSLAIEGEKSFEIISLYDAEGSDVKPLEKHMVRDGKWIIPPEQGSDISMGTFNSLGGIFSIVSKQIFGNYNDAGKVMGLAPYGEPVFPVDDFYTIENDRFVFNDNISKRFSSKKCWPHNKKLYSDLASSAQLAVEQAVLYLVAKLRAHSHSRNLVYAGGVALNSVANERIVRESGFENVFFFPPAEDSGPAVGAAYYALWKMGYKNNFRKLKRDSFGAVYTDEHIDQAINKLSWTELVNDNATYDDVAELLANDNIIAWFTGGSELGPRSLGQRSILCDPRRSDAKDVLNARVKHREGFRPFAPVILEEQVKDWFDLEGTESSTPFMLRVLRFNENSELKAPGVVHCDGTGRVQTVNSKDNGAYYQLVRAFYNKTGVPILINTSLNVMGEPIAETPEDALWGLAMTGIDYCVFDNRVVRARQDLKSILDFKVSFLLSEDKFSDAYKVIKSSGRIPVSTPWGVSLFPLEDDLVKHVVQLGFNGMLRGGVTARDVMDKMIRAGAEVSDSDMVRTLVQLRRGKMISLSEPAID